MISETISIRPRYNEVDQMGYVYHANYVSYCHQARTELMRSLKICDAYLEANNIMMPVISFNINYKQPVGYDEQIYITARLINMSEIRLKFDFEIINKKDEIIGLANSTVVFVNAQSRKPLRAPSWLSDKLQESNINLNKRDYSIANEPEDNVSHKTIFANNRFNNS